MKEKVKVVWAYVVSVVALLGLIIMYGTARATNFNFYFFGLGMLMIAPAIISIVVETLLNQPRINDLSSLKLNGTKIPVDLSKCKIITNNWTQLKPDKTDREILANILTNNSYENQATIQASLSRIKYSSFINGKSRTFISPTIAKDFKTLQILIETQKETNIYVDPNNSKHYWFDLDFLKN